jgi:hypothetical protein
MASGMMFGILEEQHAGHIVLSDGIPIRLAAGLKLERLAAGTRVAIAYRRDLAGEIVAETVTRSASPQAA